MSGSFPCYPLSLSGTPVEGERLVYCVFLDESGISIHETHVVVAGVIIHTDTQWRAVEAALAQLRDNYVAESQRKDFAFHATDLYHGRGPVFRSDKYPAEKSFKALKEILAIPSKFKLPVAVGYIMKHDKPATRAERNKSQSYHHALAATYCAISADTYLREHCPDDLAFAIAENNTATKKAVKSIYDLVKKSSSDQMEGIGTLYFNLLFSKDDLPLKKIVSGFHYVAKHEEPLLQLADACAFTLRCGLQQKARRIELLDALTNNKQCKIIGIKKTEGDNGWIEFA